MFELWVTTQVTTKSTVSECGSEETTDSPQKVCYCIRRNNPPIMADKNMHCRIRFRPSTAQRRLPDVVRVAAYSPFAELHCSLSVQANFKRSRLLSTHLKMKAHWCSL